jgi:hypothetical protein
MATSAQNSLPHNTVLPLGANGNHLHTLATNWPYLATSGQPIPLAPTPSQPVQPVPTPAASWFPKELTTGFGIEFIVLLAAAALSIYQGIQGNKLREYVTQQIPKLFHVDFKAEEKINNALYQLLGAANADRVALGIYRNGEVGASGYHFQKVTFDAEATQTGFATAHAGQTIPMTIFLEITNAGLSSDQPGEITADTTAGSRYLSGHRLSHSWYYPISIGGHRIGVVVFHFAACPVVRMESQMVNSALSSLIEALEEKLNLP